MPYKHYATHVIWANALPDGWTLNDDHSNWPTNPVLDGLPYRLESKRYNDAVYVLDIEAFKRTQEMTDKAIGLLEDDLVNANVQSQMLQEQVDLVAIAEDILENLFIATDSLKILKEQNEVFAIGICDDTLFVGGTIQDLKKILVRGLDYIATFTLSPQNLHVTVFPRIYQKYKALLAEGTSIHAVIAPDTSMEEGHFYLVSASQRVIKPEPKFSEGQEVKHPRMPILSPRAFIGGIIPNEDESAFSYWLRYADGTEEMEVVWAEEDLTPVPQTKG